MTSDHGSDETTRARPARRGENLPVGEFFDDAFGLSWRGLQTIWTSFVRPRAYFDAAEDPDWEGKYTPSLRLWLSLVAVIFFLQFLWGSANSPIMEGLTLQVDELRSYEPPMPLPEGSSEQVAQLWAKWYFAIYPILNLLGYIVLASVWGLWGVRTSFALRQRWVFGILVPSTAVSACMTVLMTFTTYELLGFFALGQIALNMAVQAITAWRGPFAALPAMGRAWRIALLQLALLFVGIFTALLSQLIGLFGMMAFNA